ncbi:MAG TPA: M56 family metallopeptidase, partial [Terriglobales bacterium]|nr:M56 family metallopeptidase [Terriglobales bacterium]
MLSNTASTLAQYAPWLLAIYVKSTVLLLAVLGTAQLMRRHSASLRHFLYSVTIASLLILPLAAALLPNLGLAVLPPHAQSTNAAASVERPVLELSFDARAANSQIRSHESKSRPAGRARQAQQPTASQNELPLNSDPQFIPQTSSSRSQLNWQGTLVLLWICGTIACVARLALVHLRLKGLVRRAAPVESIVLASRLRWLCRDLGIRREVVLLASPELDVPIAVGVLDPQIVLSPQCGEWSETRRNALLCHEIAHIKRLDALTQLLASVAAAMYWLNPFVWLVVRAMRLERERACDDYVLASGTAASDYAHELLEIVSTLVRPQPAAALAMARRSQLEGRVLALVNSRVGHGILTRGAALCLSCAVIGISFPLAAARLQERPAQPELVRAASVRGAFATVGDESLQPAPSNPPEAPAEAADPRSPDQPISAVGIPLYPNAVAGDHQDGRGTVSLFDGARVHHLSASAYFSGDKPAAVPQFYRDRLKSFGKVIECSGGGNSRVDIQLSEAAFADPSACRSGDFAEGGTELKVNGSGDERIVVVLPHGRGSEIALVRYPATLEH